MVEDLRGSVGSDDGVCSDDRLIPHTHRVTRQGEAYAFGVDLDGQNDSYADDRCYLGEHVGFDGRHLLKTVLTLQRLEGEFLAPSDSQNEGGSVVWG